MNDIHWRRNEKKNKQFDIATNIASSSSLLKD